MKLLAIDVGGTEIKYGIIDEDLNITHQGFVPTPYTCFEDFSDTIYGIYEPIKDEVEGIAMSLPGFVDGKKGRVNGGGAMKYNHGTAVGKLLEERCGCKVVLENDGKAAAIAEFRKGNLQGCQNASVCILGTGVGGGLIIDGKVVRGPHFTAGEFSFVFAGDDPDDRNSYTAYLCSTSALLAKYAELTGSSEMINGREFFRRLENDEAAQQALTWLAENVARLIYNLYVLLDVEKVAIGGGISRQPILIERIREEYDKFTSRGMGRFLAKLNEVEIVSCKFHNESNLIGAYLNYLDQAEI